MEKQWLGKGWKSDSSCEIGDYLEDRCSCRTAGSSVELQDYQIHDPKLAAQPLSFRLSDIQLFPSY